MFQVRRGPLAAGAVVLAAAAITGCGNSASSASGSSGGGSGGEYTIGELADLTAGFTDSNVPWHEGLKAAITATNAAGGINGKKINLVTMDDQGDASTGINDFQKLKADGALAIGNLGDSTIDEAIYRQATAAHISLVAVGPAPEEVNAANGYVFEYDASSTESANAMVKEVVAMHRPGVKLTAVVNPDPEGVAFAKTVGQDAKKAGIPYTGTIAPSAASDYGAGAAKVVSSGATVVVSELVGSSNSEFLRDLASAGWNKSNPVIGYSWSTQETVPWPTFMALQQYRGVGNSPAATAYQKAVKAVGSDPDAPLVVEGYADGLIIANALKRCGANCNGESFHSALQKTNTTLGGLAFGPVTFTPSFHEGPTAVAFEKYTKAGVGSSYTAPIKIATP